MSLRLILALGVLVVLGAPPPALAANSYVVALRCGAPDDAAFSVGVEVIGQLVTTDHCATPGETRRGFYQGADLAALPPADERGSRSWTLSAPDGVVIAGLQFNRHLVGSWNATHPLRWDLSTPEGRAETPPRFITSLTTNLATVPSDNIFVLSVSNSASVTSRMFCPETSCDASDSGIDLANLQVNLIDQFPPDAPTNLGGSLTAAGPVSGTPELTFHAHDRGSGIFEYILLVDGFPAMPLVRLNEGTCHSGIVPALVPCRTDFDGRLSLDTTTLSDGDHTFQLKVHDRTGQQATSASVPFKVSNPPINTALPAISGSPQVGQELSATTGTWAGNPTAFVFQWMRCAPDATTANPASCTSIAGATSSQYVLAAADVYQRVAVMVTASKTVAGASASAISAPSAPVADAQGRTAPPTGTGTGGTGTGGTGTGGSGQSGGGAGAGPGTGGSGAGPGGAADRTPPVLVRVSLTRKRFRVGKAATAIAAGTRQRRRARGTVLRLTTSEAGRLSIRIERVRPGRRTRAHRCTPVRRRVRLGRCTVYARRATLTRAIGAGRARIALSGRIGRRRMVPGRYRMSLVERDAAGNASKLVRRAFIVLAG
jgi:hypothetical protein